MNFHLWRHLVTSWNHFHLSLLSCRQGYSGELRLHLLYHYYIYFTPCSPETFSLSLYIYTMEENPISHKPIQSVNLTLGGKQVLLCHSHFRRKHDMKHNPTCLSHLQGTHISFFRAQHCFHMNGRFFWFPTPSCSFSVAKDSILLQQFGGNYIKKLLFIIKTFFYNSSIYCTNLQGC